jgi:hypothetical protein
VIAAIDHLTAGSTRLAEREKLARLRQVVRKSTPDRAEAERALHAMRAELFHYARSFPAAFRKHR